MPRSLILSIVFIIALVFTVSCSGGDGNIGTTPPAERDSVTTATSGTTACFGLWQIVIDTTTGKGDIVQMRSADKIINVLGFMEPPPLTLMDLDWPNLVINDVEEFIEVGVILTHPINDGVFTGFDVRGVCFGPEVTNADGLTIIPGPEYFSGVPFGYQDGLLGAPDSVANYEGLAGFKYYCDGLDEDESIVDFFSVPANLDDRGKFGANQENQRDFILDWTDSAEAFFVFNYAIYANYNWPVGTPPWGVDDFDIAMANCAEAFCINITETNNDLWYNSPNCGGTLDLVVDIWDWQGDISKVTIQSIEALVLPAADGLLAGPGDTDYSYRYAFNNLAACAKATGDLDLLITVTDAQTFGDAWFLDLLPTTHAMFDEYVYTCWSYTTNVIDCPPPTTIDLIAPAVHLNDGILFPAAVTGTGFIDGAVAVALQKAGESDIVATTPVWISDTTINCNLTIPPGTATGSWDVQVTNGCGTPGVGAGLFDVVGLPAWGPSVSLDTGNSKVRATSSSTISDSYSTYDSRSTFNVSGANATGGVGPYTYLWRVSQSPTSVTGTDSWHSFTFNNGGSFVVSWYSAPYTTWAPDRLYLWVVCRDSLSNYSDPPVACGTTMRLSRVHRQYSSFSASTWYVQTSSSHALIGGVGSTIVWLNGWRGYPYYDSLIGYGRAYHMSSFPMYNGRPYTVEFSSPSNWDQYTGCYASIRHANTYTGSGEYGIGSAIYDMGSGQIWTGNWTASITDTSRYTGMYIMDLCTEYDGFAFYFWFDNWAVYENPT